MLCFLFQSAWRCSICIRGSTNRDIPPSQSFLRASAAAQQQKQREQQHHLQQDQTGTEPESPKGVAAIINRVAKKQESFDTGGPRYVKAIELIDVGRSGKRQDIFIVVLPHH